MKKYIKVGVIKTGVIITSVSIKFLFICLILSLIFVSIFDFVGEPATPFIMKLFFILSAIVMIIYYKFITNTFIEELTGGKK